MDIDADEHAPLQSHDSSLDQGHILSATPASMPSPDSNAVAEAFERRLRQQRSQQQEKPSGYVAFDEHHEKRQLFRRMIDPGILRPNARPLALESLRILLKLAENILEHPDDAKYQKFKPTNANIKRLLVDPKGTLEYAREMGFNPEVENFQPYYVFNKTRHIADLRIGADILKEALEREETKEERTERMKKEEKAVAAAQVANIKTAFMDDRKSRALVDRRERELRNARATAGRASTSHAVPKSTPGTMPTSGRTLAGQQVQLEPAQDDHDGEGDDDDDE